MSEHPVVEIDDAWIVARRPAKNPVSPRRPYGCLLEKERTAGGRVENVATIFLTNRECPFRCLMCDLWKNTTDQPVSEGDIPAQIEWALARLPDVKHVKLYNSGSFFDGQAVPPGDIPRIAKILESFNTVIVENHPRFVNERCPGFQNLLRPRLQVAMGLETVHPVVLKRLNKRMTVGDFEDATAFLVKNDIPVRAFILLRPPFLDEEEGVIWAKRSIDFAFDRGVECCVIIPTRGGNGALERFQEMGLFCSPTVKSLEEVLEYGIERKRGRVFADLWDVEKFSDCRKCQTQRIERMHRMNMSQELVPRVNCDCDGSSQIERMPRSLEKISNIH